ncbi:MAG: glycoside hydrolase, partial [Bacteroidetes bacterium]|nr:glycoside hydrolase [Bacteroidota bacterium]
MIGPHRGGRTVGAVGVPQQPNVFYIGVNNGGVWKTNDYGRTWKPIFDDQPTGSIGDVAVAPSNPEVVYVASGEGIQRPDLSTGDGIYKSMDAGKTWEHLGLRDGQQIGGLAIDPKNENRVFAAVLGHPYGANKERGVYRTIDGGKTWQNVLYKDENTGAIQVAIDPNNSDIIYADLWAGRQGPWENGAWNGTQSGLFKSIDGGNTWKQLTKGLPTTEQGLSRIGFCVAASNSNRLYATVEAKEGYGGIYRSDDGGESWQKLNSDARFWGRGDDFAEVKADPKNADIVFTADVVVWKSVNAGKTWDAFRGAPGGDDYHRLWINPNNPDIILIACDQGAIVTVNGGQTFSSWYNQPTAQFYHVSTDNAFPYNVYGGQQESGSIGIASRGNDGEITFREYHPVGVEEYGYVAADPLDPNIIYGGKITKYDKRTGQVQNIAPDAVRSGKYRFVRTAPVLFSPIDPKTLYFAGNVLFKTTNGGHSWETISPDLTRETWDIPESIGIYRTDEMKKMPRRGVIYTVAPSPKNINTIWAGTDDGLIHVTHDGGKTWNNVTPPSVTSWSKISLMDASHFDVNTAYAAVNRIRLDDQKPHIYKTT